MKLYTEIVLFAQVTPQKRWTVGAVFKASRVDPHEDERVHRPFEQACTRGNEQDPLVRDHAPAGQVN